MQMQNYEKKALHPNFLLFFFNYEIFLFKMISIL